MTSKSSYSDDDSGISNLKCSNIYQAKRYEIISDEESESSQSLPSKREKIKMSYNTKKKHKYVSQERIKNRDEPESKFTNSHMSIRNNLKFRIDFDFF